MILTIKKGSHRRKEWWRQLAIWVDKRQIARGVMFYPDCQYDLKNDNQYDINKLFGLCYLWNKRDSARIGWRWDADNNRIEIFLYCHVNGRMEFKYLTEIFTGQSVQAFLRIRTGLYEAEILTEDGNVQLGRDIVNYTHDKRVSYQLGFFFGGNEPAPNNMTVQLKNI